MTNSISNIDPNGLLEYSVVYTDRSLNHMSQSFQGVMNDISSTLKSVYNADSVTVVPGSGTFGMEAVARQFANNKHCLVIRNGWFSFRWTQIFDMADLPSSSTVMKAKQISDDSCSAFAPAAIDEVVARILVFAPHVETSAGMILPSDYIKAVTEAVHAVGGIFVLDCIASGAIWVDMKEHGVDVLISAPQKGWSGSPCCGLVMMNQTAIDLMETTQSNSFACDLKKWSDIMGAYENGGHALGDKIRALLVNKGIKSVAAEGFQAPGVVVNYTQDLGLHNGSKFAAQGMQIAAGVPLQCDEPDNFQTFRLGLFGLDKLYDVDAAVARFEEVLESVLS